MYKYLLTYDIGSSVETVSGEVPERYEVHDLLIMHMEAEGKPGRIIGTKTSEESLSKMRITNLWVTWLSMA
jgi:hypothetical protein